MRRRPAWSRRRDARRDRRAGDVGVLAAGAAGLRLLGAGAHRAATFPIAKRSRLGSRRGRLTSPKVHSSTPTTAVEEQRRQVGRRVERRVVLLRLNADADTIDPFAFECLVTETAAGMSLDVMLEAKAKELALLALRSALKRRGSAPVYTRFV